MPDVGGPYVIDIEHYGDWGQTWYTQTGTPGVFELAGDLYMVIWSTANHPAASGGLRNVGVAKSIDGGVTWARVGAYLTPPNNPNQVWVTPDPPVGKLRMLVGSVAAGSTRTLVEFDLATGVWTVISSSIVPTQRLDNYAYDPVAGVDWIFYKDGATVTSGLWAVPYSGGVWGAPIFIAGSVTEISASSKQVRADPSNGRLHVVYYWQDSNVAPWTRGYYYVQVKPDGSLTAPILLAEEHSTHQLGDVYNRTVLQIGFTSTEVVIPWQRFVGPGFTSVVPAIWALTPFTANAPALTQFWDEIQTSSTIIDVSVSQTLPDGSVTVWWAPNSNIATGDYESALKYRTFKSGVFGPEVTFHDELAFPTTPPAGTTYVDSSMFGITQPILLSSGVWFTSTALNLEWTDTGFNLYTQGFWIGQSQTATLTITKVTIPASDSGLFNLQIDGLTQAADQGNGGTTGPDVVAPGAHQVAETPGTGTIQNDYTASYGGDAAPDGSVTLAAGENKTAIITNTRKAIFHPLIFGTRRIVILEPNAFDDCLKGLPKLYRQIPFDQGICCVPDRYDYGQWQKFRPDAVPFRAIQAIPTPLAVDGDVLVTTFYPPIGWDGLLHGIFNRYTGPGFRDGGGDIQWRLKFGPVYGKQMGNILVQMGEISQFYKLNQGIFFRSHRPIQFWVYAPNTSGGILPVNSQIVCGLEGWIFPRK